jgi:hypothetical protein
MGAPSPVIPEQLEELRIGIKPPTREGDEQPPREDPTP